MTDHPKITGARVVATLPDAGPWQMVEFRGVLIASSQTSGVWWMHGDKLERVEYRGPRPMDKGDL